MLDLAGLAVHKVFGAHDRAPERGSNCLMSQAYSQHRHPARELLDQLNADSGILRRTRTGRKHYPVRVQVLYIFHRDLVIAAYLDFCA